MLLNQLHNRLDLLLVVLYVPIYASSDASAFAAPVGTPDSKSAESTPPSWSPEANQLDRLSRTDL